MKFCKLQKAFDPPPRFTVLHFIYNYLEHIPDEVLDSDVGESDEK